MMTSTVHTAPSASHLSSAGRCSSQSAADRGAAGPPPYGPCSSSPSENTRLSQSHQVTCDGFSQLDVTITAALILSSESYIITII